MVSERHLIYFSCVLAIVFGYLTNAQEQPIFQAHYCNVNNTSRIYTSNSVFRTNLDNLTSILSSSSARFYNFSIGQNPDRVYVIALCRGDVVMETCRSCLTEANTKLRNLCPNQKQSIGWDDNCMLRYWDEPIFNTMQTSPDAYTFSPATVSNVSQFSLDVGAMIKNRLLEEASRGTAVQKFAAGNTTVGLDNNMTMYAHAECTPDLSSLQCRDCLSGASEKLLQCCSGRIGGRVFRPSCNLRYEILQFYSASPNGTTNATVPSPSVQG